MTTDRVITADQLSKMFHSIERIDPNQPGYHWRNGWNDALRQAMDYSAAPLRREWVGLTEEEVDECYYWKGRQWTTDELVRHVEAKLKEKNA